MLTTDSDVLNPSTAKINALATYNFNHKTNPISLGTTVGFLDNAGKYSRFFEMANIRREGEPSVVCQSQVVSRLFAKDLRLISESNENNIIFFSEVDTNKLYGYRYFDSARKRVLAAWFSWTLTGNIVYHCMLDDALYVVTSNADKSKRQQIRAQVPYNIGMQLSIMAKSQDDGLQILEQILPYFQPDYTVTIKPIDGWTTYKQDVPIILNSVSIDDSYEGDYTSRRVLTYNLEFNMKMTFYSGTQDSKVIKSIDIDWLDKANNGFLEGQNLEVNPSTAVVTDTEVTGSPGSGEYKVVSSIDYLNVPTSMTLTLSSVSGTFQVGEKIKGYIRPTGLNPITPWSQGIDPTIIFRAAQLNHKEGPYNAPTKVFPESPYENTPLSASYASTSTILNVDTFSLSQEAQGDYYGWVETGMVLKGEASGAEATITDLRLISDLAADLTGSFYIPNPNNIDYPRFETGTKVFTLINDPDNDQDNCTSVAEEAYTASGTLETVQENIISVRNARIEQKQEFQERNVSEVLDGEVVASRVLRQHSEQVLIGWYDPLAQSFLVEDATGVYLTKCDVFFRSTDDNDIPCVFQIRTMENGFPTQHILPFSEVVLAPDDIETSADGSVATTVSFKSPVYCESGKEYAIALASNSTKYSVYISRIGEQDLITQTFISNQPYLGSLFKSQNASTWEASQWEDLKFTLYRADFVESGSVELYNPQLAKGNDQIPQLLGNPLVLNSKEIRVGLGTTVADGGLKPGNVVYQMGTQATAKLAGVAGSVTSLAITNAGLGYSPSDGQITYSGVNLVTITGNGRGATADITINSGNIVASGATISGGGSGYQAGDVVGFNTLGITTQGRDGRLSVVSIGGTSELVLTQVQGEFTVGTANTVMYIDRSNTVKVLNSSHGGDVQVASVNEIAGKDGVHIKVNHQNHGMYWTDNQVQISGVESDIKPTKLAVAYPLGSTGEISVDDASAFSTFENVGVGTTNTGFLRIGNEIIEYTSVSGNLIGGNIVREQSTVGSGPAVSYPVGSPVYKYELGGVNLARINKTHDLNDVTVANPITFDSYNVKLDMSTKWDANGANDDRSNDAGFPKLFLNSNKSSGGYKIRASQNMPFEVIRPLIHNVTVQGCSLSGELRTTTATSFSGTEIPWINNGFEPIAINQTNYLTTPRTIANKENAAAQLAALPGEKSLQLRLFLNTSDSRVSPVIDGQRCSVITTSNRVNNVITNYATDSRANSITTDPTACQYITKEISLENGATSIKVMVDAHIHLDSDIRAFYAISDKEGFEPIFTPFPGYKNLSTRGLVINEANNDGQSDKLVPKSNGFGFDAKGIQFKEYTFTVDRLPSFRTYRVKLVMTSNSQVYVPRMRDLRVVALA